MLLLSKMFMIYLLLQAQLPTSSKCRITGLIPAYIIEPGYIQTVSPFNLHLFLQLDCLLTEVR